MNFYDLAIFLTVTTLILNLLKKVVSLICSDDFIKVIKSIKSYFQMCKNYLAEFSIYNTFPSTRKIIDILLLLLGYSTSLITIVYALTLFVVFLSYKNSSGIFFLFSMIVFFLSLMVMTDTNKKYKEFRFKNSIDFYG